MSFQAAFFQWHQASPPKKQHHRQASSNGSIDFKPPETRVDKGRIRFNNLHNRMALHLQTGFNLMKDGKFEEATTHFQNLQSLNTMGVSRKWGATQFVHEVPETVDAAKDLVQAAARENMAFDKGGKLSIKFANIGLILDPEAKADIEQNHPQQAAILKHLAHENALMAAEESIHTYQHMRKNTLSYEPLEGQESDDDGEIDIATTLEKYNVPVTRDFLDRYRGRHENVSHPQVWDLVETDQGEIARIQLPRQTARKDKRKALMPLNVMA
jgi:hypothetical protein